MKKVSFVIPTYNSATWLPHAVKSCLNQTYKNTEIIIVDDCSTDWTNNYVNWLFKQGLPNLFYKKNDVNMGRSASRNIGNLTATGDIICVLDADDMASEDRAALTVKKMKSYDVCYGSAVMMDAIGNQIGESIAEPVTLDNCIKTKHNKIVHSTMAYTKALAIKYPYQGGDISRLGIDDWDMQIRMMKDGVKFGVIPEMICAYRMMPTTISNTRDEKEVILAKNVIIGGIK